MKTLLLCNDDVVVTSHVQNNVPLPYTASQLLLQNNLASSSTFYVVTVF